MIATERDHATSRRASGVRVKADHWASRTVHSFRRWTGDTTLSTWCGIEVDLQDGGAHTTDHVTCKQCPQASKAEGRG